MSALRVHVWSDIACPWCYVGKRRLEAVVGELATRLPIEVVWRSFELDPSAPRVRQDGCSYAERLARKYGSGIAQAEEMIARMTAVAAADGLELRFDRIQPGNTFDAHRVLQLARQRGVQGEVQERLLRGYLTEGEPIGDPSTLARLGAEGGLDAGELRGLLAGDRHAAEVRADEEEARRLGIHAVPFFVLNGRYGISGAQPVELLRRALERVGAETPRAAEGAACGPDGCA